VLKVSGIVLVVVAMAALAFTRVEADDPVSSSVSFNKEVIRIIRRKCEPCHAPGGLAMSLSDYRDARAWGRAIREELVEHRMPPALIARGYGRYETDPSLNAREMATFLTWLDGGMPRGSDADLPPAAPVAEDAASTDGGTRLDLPPQTIPAREDVVIRRVTIDAAAAAGRTIGRVQFRPGDRRVLRGAMVFASRADGVQWIGGWLPWQHAVVPPSQYVFAVPNVTTLVVDLYYRGADAPVTDRSAVELSLAPESVKGRIEDVVVDAAPGKTGAARLRGAVTLKQPTSVWAIHTSPDAAVMSMELRAERPDGSVEVLMWIPHARADWPVALVMREPLTLPAGSRMMLVAETDSRPATAPPPRVTVSVLR
jgi:hypothetical protein